jgi:acyl-CoA dehydrogenase
MDFAPSARSEDVCARMWDFMRERVFPAETVYARWREQHDPHAHPPVMDELASEARKRDLWNLFLPDISGLSNVDYAQVAEISGW